LVWAGLGQAAKAPRAQESDIIGSSIVVAMETSLLAVQAPRVVIMPFLDLVDAGKAWQTYVSWANLRECRALKKLVETLDRRRLQDADLPRRLSKEFNLNDGVARPLAVSNGSNL
jgi:hypothetical protein